MGNYNQAGLRAGLGERLLFFEELGSTNEEALALGARGGAAGLVVLAERQTAGRGRRGAAWFCRKGAGLAFSVLMRPSFEKALWPRLSLVAGLAVARSIEAVGLAPEIKWPNDVLIGGRKVCGILVEAGPDCVVVGVGLNVGEVELPNDLKDVATSLAKEGGREQSREEYLLAIVEGIDFLAKSVAADFEELLEMIRARCALTGQEVTFIAGQESRRGTCQGIGDSGELLVREGSDLKRYFAADQIRVVRSGKATTE